MEWFLQVLRNYTNFKGRGRRAEYWMFTLFCLFFSLFLLALDNVFELAFEHLIFGPLYILFVIGFFTPTLAATVRRLHDVGKSGWMFLVILIPVIGLIWLFILLTKNSDPTNNRYGPSPKAGFY